MADKTIFSRLQKLFSTNTIVRKTQDGVKVVDTDEWQNMTTNLVDRFMKMKVTNYGTGQTASSMAYQQVRIDLFRDYDSMDMDPILSSALDVYSDETTARNEMGNVLKIHHEDDQIKQILENLFYDIINVEFNLWPWTRNLVKYGDFFLQLEIADKLGIVNVMALSTYEVSRVENFDPENPQRVKFIYAPYQNPSGGYGQTPKKEFENYEIAHFRLISDPSYLPYGRSYLEPGRKIFKQLTLMEDAMLIHRIMRAPEKRLFYVNVGNIAPNEVDGYMEKMKQRIKKTPYIDPQTGDYNMMNLTEDFYLPLRGNDTSTKIDTLKGMEYTAIEDVAYLRDKLFAALRVPKAFLGYEKDLTGKATLASEDIRFARTVERIQRIVVSELTKIALVHLYTQGFDDAELTNFELSLTTPSIIYEQEKIALWKEKVELAGNIMDKSLLPTDWIYQNIFHFSEDQYAEFRNQTIEDKKRSFRISQIENEGNDPVESGTSFGTPHDLASLYGKGRYGEVPIGYDEKEAGRPEEKVSDYGTQDHALGKDPIGSKGMHEPLKAPAGTGATWTLENARVEYLKNKKMLESIKPKKTNVFEEPSILN